MFLLLASGACLYEVTRGRLEKWEPGERYRIPITKIKLLIFYPLIG